MTLPTILHLVDDASAGGVMRMLSHIETAPDFARFARHRVEIVSRSRIGARRDGADMIVSHLSVNWRSLPALMTLRARHPGLPLVHVEHSYTEVFTALNVPRKGRFFTLLRTAYSLFDRVVAVSAGQADWMTRRGLVSADALSVISPAVGLGAFAALRPVYHPPQVIGAIGRFDRQKGFDILIAAFRKVENPALRLRLIGDGPERAALQELAAGDPRIAFDGFASDPAAAMSGVEAVAMPSRWEAYGLVALEARAAGRPLLAARVDGLADHAAAGATAVAGQGVDAWAEALRRLTDADAPARIAVAEARADAARAEARFAEGWSALVAGLFSAGDAAPERDLAPAA